MKYTFSQSNDRMFSQNAYNWADEELKKKQAAELAAQPQPKKPSLMSRIVGGAKVIGGYLGDEAKKAGNYIANEAKYTYNNPVQAGKNVGNTLKDPNTYKSTGNAIMAGIDTSTSGAVNLINRASDYTFGIKDTGGAGSTSAIAAENKASQEALMARANSQATTPMQKSLVTGANFVGQQVPFFLVPETKIAKGVQGLGGITLRTLARGGENTALMAGLEAGNGASAKDILTNAPINFTVGMLLTGAGEGYSAITTKISKNIAEKAVRDLTDSEANVLIKLIADQKLPKQGPAVTSSPIKTPNIEWQTGQKAWQQFDAKNNKSIIVLPKNTSQETVWHEVAHAVDRQNPTLRDTLAPEIKTITGKDAIDNEAFAGAFKLVAGKPELRTQAPKISAIMDSIKLPENVKPVEPVVNQTIIPKPVVQTGNPIIDASMTPKPIDNIPTSTPTPFVNKNTTESIGARVETPQTSTPLTSEGMTPLTKEAQKYKTPEEFISRVRGSSTQYGDYVPEIRTAGMQGYENVTNLGIKPDEMVTIYRGIDDVTGKLPRKINDGDFVTTDFDSALAYTGSPKDVVSMEVSAKHLYSDNPVDFKDDPFYTGSEYVYTKSKVSPLNDKELTDIYNQAHVTPKVETPSPLSNEAKLTGVSSPDNMAKDLVESKTKDEIDTKLQKIFGTHEELDSLENVDTYKNPNKKLAIADDYMADVERAAIERNYEETTRLLKEVSQRQKEAGITEFTQGMDNEGKLTLYDTPKVIEARKMADSIPETINVNTPERTQLRQERADELYNQGSYSGKDAQGNTVYGGKVNQNRRADIILGPPAAGKTRLVNPISKQYGSLIGDSDMVKEKMPEFANGIGAKGVHRETALIADEMMVGRAVDNGDNLVLPRLGKNEKTMRDLVNNLKANGYDVHLHYMDLPVEKTTQRALTRFDETGRFVDPAYILNEVAGKPKEVYNKIKNMEGVSSYEQFTNDVPKGQEPILVERGTNQATAERGRLGLQRSDSEPNTTGVGNQIQAKSSTGKSLPTAINGLNKQPLEQSGNFGKPKTGNSIIDAAEQYQRENAPKIIPAKNLTDAQAKVKVAIQEKDEMLDQMAEFLKYEREAVKSADAENIYSDKNLIAAIKRNGGINTTEGHYESWDLKKSIDNSLLAKKGEGRGLDDLVTALNDDGFEIAGPSELIDKLNTISLTGKSSFESNPMWYQDLYKKLGKTPSKGEIKTYIDKNLNSMNEIPSGMKETYLQAKQDISTYTSQLAGKEPKSIVEKILQGKQTGNTVEGGTGGFTTSKYYKGDKESRYGRKINTQQINTLDDIQKLNEDIGKEYTKYFQDVKGGVKPNEVTLKQASDLGWTPEKIAQIPEGALLNDAQTAATAQVKADLVMQLAEETRKFKVNESEETKGKMKDLLAKIISVDAVIKRSEVELGRATQIKNAVPIPREFDDEALFDTLKNAGIGDVKDVKAALRASDKLQEATAKDVFWSIYYNGILSGTSTHAKNFLDTGFNTLIEQGIVDPVIHPANIVNQIKTIPLAIRRGIQEASDVWTGRQIVQSKYSVGDKNFKNKFLKVINSVGKALSTEDAFFRGINKEHSLTSLAYEQARKDGLGQIAATLKVKTLKENPTPAMLEQAVKESLRNTYNQKPEGWVGAVAMGWGSISNKVPPLKFLQPFSKIVGNVLNAGIDWTPFGIKRAIQYKKAGGEFANREMFQQIARATLGTVGMGYAFVAATQGKITGSGPSNVAQRKQLEDQGWQANSIKIGDKYFSYQNLGAWGIPLAIVANYADAKKYNKLDEQDVDKRVAYAIFGTMRTITDKSFLSNVSQLFDAMKNNDPKYMQRFTAGIITAPYPNLLKQIGNYFNDTKKDPQNFYDYLANSMGYPFNKQTATKLTIFGEPQKENRSILGRIIGQSVVSEKSDQMSTLQKKMSQNDVQLTIPTKTTKIQPLEAEESRIMTDKELRQYQEIYGKNLKTALSESNNYLMGLSSDDLESEITAIVNDVRDNSKYEFIDKYNIKK